MSQRVPEDPSEITPQWLSEALRERFADASVASIDVLGIEHGTNSNARLRVTYDAGPELPERLFLKLPPLDPARREAVNRTGMGRRETLFYTSMAERVPMRVPRPYVARVDERSGSFVLLIEDLGASGCSFLDPEKGVSPQQAERAMSDYAALHLRYDDPAVREREAGWVEGMPGGSSYGTSMLQFGLDHHRARLTDRFAELAELYIARQSDFEAAWERGDSTVLQGDSHIGNLFEDAGHIGFLDWGLIQLGPAMRDVSYFVCMALSPENRRKHERALIERYLEARRQAGGTAISFEDAWHQHRVQATYTVVASCPVVTFPEDQPNEQARLGRAFLERAECAVEDLDARAAFRDVAGI